VSCRVDRHNVLVLFSDEHDPRITGMAGHPLVRTPNLDALAARGTRFDRAYTPSPVCVPARASLATGRWVHQIRYWDNAMGYDGRVPGWGHALQGAGGRVESIGKLHYRQASDPTGFDRQHEPMHLDQSVGQVWGSVRDPMPETMGRASPLFAQVGAGESPYNRYDERSAESAVAWLEERAKEPSKGGDAKPWVLFVGLVAPHFPLIVPQRFLDLYPLARIPFPKLQPRDGYRLHPWVAAQRRHYDHDAALGTDERRLLAIASYLGLVTFVDELIGRVLAALERTGLAATTQVIYSADHGDNLGARGMWNKCLLYRESTSVPLIVAGPGVPEGRVCRTHANLVDLAPTILEATGTPTLPGVPQFVGRSLLELARTPDDTQREGFSEYHAVGAPSGAYMVAFGRWKYHYYVGYPPELFDLEADPEEANDLAGDPAQATVLHDMESRLRAMLDPEQVDRLAKDDQNALVARFGGRERALSVGPPGATPVPGA
jgi:choline-sulfatase